MTTTAQTCVPLRSSLAKIQLQAFKQLNEFSRKLDTKIKPIVGIYNRMKDDEKKKQERKEQKDLEAAMAESRAMYLNGSSQRQLRQRVRPETAKPYNTRRSSRYGLCTEATHAQYAFQR